jgi:hypothetical protein
MKKTFDCVEMKRRGGQRVYELVKGMTPEQEAEFWRQRTEAFLAQREAKRAKAAASATP